MSAYNEHPEYAARITSEHASAPKYRAMVDVVASIIATGGDALKTIQESFDLDVAEGVQLDAVGRWVGISRQVKSPITGVYFTWGDSSTPLSTGWSYGVWKGEYDPTDGVESLDDETYRSLIRARVAANQWDGSIAGAYNVWETAFKGVGSVLVIQDNQDMTMLIGVSKSVFSGLYKSILSRGDLTLKPAGVRIINYRYVVEPSPLFAWGVDNSNLAGWGSGQWGEIYAGA